jgi:hypothetical protein
MSQRSATPETTRTPKVMSTALIVALVFTVVLLVVTAYFIMGSLPLLILKHDTPWIPASSAASSTRTI